MPIRIPTEEDLLRLAEANYFELSDDELEQFQDLLPRLFADYEVLDRIPLPATPLKYRDRDAGHKPPRSDDPFNAIVRRCALKGAASGKLAGKRFGLKNNICVSGMPMTCASLVLAGYTADTDATIVTWLLDAGAEIVATLNLDNFAFSGAGDTSAHGPTRNPHNTNHLAGGSSGGSAAALYYDDIDITIGGDQGGSIRIPASWCGVVGHKPTHGLVPYTGIAGIDGTFDHAGPMSRTVADSALTMEAIAGKDPLDPRQGEVTVQPYTEIMARGASGLRIGVVKEGFGLKESDPAVDECVRKALRVLGEAGARVAEVSNPAHLEARGIVWGLVAEGATAYLRTNGMGYHWQGLYNSSLIEVLGKSRRAQADDFPATVKMVLLIGSYMAERYHGSMYAKAQNLRPWLRASYDRLLEQVDVLAMPTTPMTAHAYDPDIDIVGLLTHGWNMLNNTAPFDMTGHPSISVPCGKVNGLPVGLMLVGKRFDDGTVFRAAHAFEQQADWENL
jgi:amidase